MSALFELGETDLSSQSPDRGVRLFRDLLWAECGRLGDPVSAVDITTWIHVPDGGIDANISRTRAEPASQLIEQGYTGYQIKTGDSFRPWEQAAVRRELFREKDVAKGSLGDAVGRCLENDGRYMLVCFGLEFTEPQRQEAIKHFRDFFEQCGYPQSRVVIWGQSNLIGVFQQFPSLVLSVKNVTNICFQFHDSWAQNGEMQLRLEKTPDYDDKCEGVREVLRRDDGAQHVRIIADAGSGKSRFVLEATRTDDLAPLVLYVETEVDCRTLLGTLCLPDNAYHLILVVDDCTRTQSIQIWDRLKTRGARVKLITIHMQGEDREDGVHYAALPELTTREITNIIRAYVGPQSDVDRWVELAGSSPRFAHMIGTNLRNHPEDVLRPVGNVYDRILAGTDDPNSESVRKRRMVLRHLALFARFGYRPPVESEGRAVAELASETDPTLSHAAFYEIVEWLRGQRLLQGVSTLYITPKALHIRMWREYWDNYERAFDLERFLARLGGNAEALAWFFEMFKYAAQSAAARRVAQRLMGAGGPFEDGRLLKTDLGGRFFLALTEADPEQALRCLNNTVGTWTLEDRLAFKEGRQWVVWALERTAVWRDLFADSARLLLALGEAENATNANNSSGMFAELFSLGYGRLAPTEAAPADRIIVLEEAFASGSRQRRELAIRACRSALQTQGISRVIGAEYQGLRVEPELWTPKTYGDLYDAYRLFWRLLIGQLDGLPPDERPHALEAVFECALNIIQIPSLSGLVIESLEALSQKPYVDAKSVLSLLLQMRRYEWDSIPAEAREKYDRLQATLTGTGFSAMMRRYVGMSLLDDEYDSDGNRVDTLSNAIKSLAQDAINDQDLLCAELGWLATTDAVNAYRFGYELGKRDSSWVLLPSILRAHTHATANESTQFLGGYMRAMFEDDQAAWEEALGGLERDEALRRLLPELVWRSGMSESAAKRVLSCISDGIVPATRLRLFVWSRAVQSLSESTFHDWIDSLLSDASADGAQCALELWASFYLRSDRKHELPEHRTREILLHDAFFGAEPGRRVDPMEVHHWAEVAQQYIKTVPGRRLELAEKMLANLHAKGSIIGYYHSPALVVLEYIVREHPAEVWQIIGGFLRVPLDERAFHIRHWLGGSDGGGAIRLIPPNTLWNWIDEDPDNRAWLIAGVVPKTFSASSEEPSLARGLLVRYGDCKRVQDSLLAHLFTETWTGSQSAHYREKKAALVAYQAEESHERVRSFLDLAIRVCDDHIERALISEERED